VLAGSRNARTGEASTCASRSGAATSV
jgi:hypothetical protein